MPSGAAPLPSEIVDRFLGSSPVDVFAMAKALGMTVSALPLPPDVSGKTDLDRDGSFIVAVNASQSRERARFTVAHAIAHFVLHRDLIHGGITEDARYRSSLPEDIEIQASRYAATLLMPRRLVSDLCAGDAWDEAGAAKAFGVAPAILRPRLRELGIEAPTPEEETSPAGPSR